MNIDVRVGSDRLQFSTQWAGLHPDVKAVIEEGFDGGETDDFYEGMLAGLSFAFVIQQQLPESVNTLTGAAIAYIARMVRKDYKENDRKCHKLYLNIIPV